MIKQRQPGTQIPGCRFMYQQRLYAPLLGGIAGSVPIRSIPKAASQLQSHAQEDKAAALEKAKAVEEKLRNMKLTKAAETVANGVKETLTYMDFPAEHWTRIRTNNVLERINREIKRRTKVVGTFPDGESALMPVCARLRHITSSVWGTKRYLNMDHLPSMETEQEIKDIG